MVDRAVQAEYRDQVDAGLSPKKTYATCKSSLSRRLPPADVSHHARLGDCAKSSTGAGSSVGAAVHPDGAVDQFAEHLMVHVVETFEVEAPLPHLVRTKLLQQLRIPVLNAANEVQDEVCIAR